MAVASLLVAPKLDPPIERYRRSISACHRERALQLPNRRPGARRAHRLDGYEPWPASKAEHPRWHTRSRYAYRGRSRCAVPLLVYRRDEIALVQDAALQR